jgi:hypothetical protein
MERAAKVQNIGVGISAGSLCFTSTYDLSERGTDGAHAGVPGG